MVPRHILTFLTWTLLGAASSSCRPSVIPSDPKVTNGLPISKRNHAEVVMLSGTDWVCTGTFISDAALVTAAHCINGGIVTYEKKQPFRTLLHPSIDPHKSIPNKYDLAVLVYPRGTSSAHLSLLARAPRKGESITIVGFGANTYTIQDREPTGIGTKRSGINSISDLKDGEIQFQGVSRPRPGSQGLNAASAPGDSGGAVIIDNHLAGVIASGYEQNGRKYSFAVDLSQPETLRFLKSALEKASLIPDTSRE